MNSTRSYLIMSMEIALQITGTVRAQQRWNKKNNAGKQGVRFIGTYKAVNIACTF